MNFDIKDVKSWANRHDVKIGDEGYFADNLEAFKEGGQKSHVAEVSDKLGYPFLMSRDNVSRYCFFLPLDKVKEDKPKEKKYRPFKTMREITEIVYSKDFEYNNLSVGDSLLIRRKGDEHFHQNILITSLGFDESDLISMNEKSMQEWLDEFEFLAKYDWQPFGVEVEDE